MQKPLKSLFLLLLLTSTSLFAQQKDNRLLMLDSLNQVLTQNEQLRGAYAIYVKGELFASGNLGDQEVDSEKGLYRIGSISKTYTAVMILMAKEGGLLNLEDKLSQWFPEIPNADEISIKMMLNHRSGIHNFTNDASYAQIMYKEQDRKSMIERFATLDPDFSPDSDFNYSNTNYVLLSYILEDVYDKPIAEILEEKIQSKTKIKPTYFFENEKRSDLEQDSYYWTGEWQTADRTHPSLPSGAGAIASAPRQLCEFMRGIHQGVWINEESVNVMLDEKAYGLGIMPFPYFEKRAYGHNGGIDGFLSHASYFPKEEVAIAVCLNGTQYPLNDLLVDLLSIYFEREDYKLPTFETISLEEAVLEQYIGTYKSSNFPLDIKVFIENGALKAQATGQGAFPLNSSGEHKFEFKRAGIKVEFQPSENLMLFNQAGMKVRFER